MATSPKLQPAITATWIKCSDGKWCPLYNLNLDSVGEVVGVYVIWHEGNPGRVVRLGQGKIKNRLSEHRNDQEILGYSLLGTLRVTWASVPSTQLDGVERYLANTYSPLVGDCFPDVEPIAVNLP